MKESRVVNGLNLKYIKSKAVGLLRGWAGGVALSEVMQLIRPEYWDGGKRRHHDGMTGGGKSNHLTGRVVESAETATGSQATVGTPKNAYMIRNTGVVIAMALLQTLTSYGFPLTDDGSHVL